jgi:hypothetical protein
VVGLALGAHELTGAGPMSQPCTNTPAVLSSG